MVHFASIMVVGVVAVMILIRFLPAPVWKKGEGWTKTLWAPLGKGLFHLLLLIKESFAWLFDLKRTAWVFLLSPVILFCYVAILKAAADGLGIFLPWVGAFFTQGLVAIGVALPSAPGFIGTLHLMCQEGLGLFGASKTGAASVAVLYHLVTWVVTVATGLYFFFSMSLGVKDLKAAQTAQKETLGKSS